MEGTLKLTKSTVELQKGRPCNKNWPLKVKAESTIPGLESEIFVYQAAAEGDPIDYDRFSNVASLQDMNVIPKGAPITTDDEPYENAINFYRVDTVELDFYNLHQLERVWRLIQIDAKNLVKEYKKSVNLVVEEEVEYE